MKSHEARIGRIFISPEAGQPMKSVPEVYAIEGVGLLGDRYSRARGVWQTVKDPRITTRHVSLILKSAIDAANLEHGSNFEPSETRRNLLIEGDLDLANLVELVGKEFLVGKVRMRGVEECAPCQRPSALTKKKHSFKKTFEKDGRAGIRAEILSSGVIAQGDVVRIERVENT